MFDKTAYGIVIAIIFITLVVLFCAVLVKLYIHKIKTYTQVIYQKDVDFQKALNETIVETQEQVLNNISQELHDDAGQQLSAINFRLENLKLDSNDFRHALEPVSEAVNELSRSVRNISHSLNNQLLLRQDIIKAIENETQRISQGSSLTIQFSCREKSSREFSTNEKIVIYRIFQEAMSNILKHSKATFVDVRIKTQPFFEMTIIDDGRGFERVLERQSLGISGMEHRAAMINYRLQINSIPGNGTTLTLAEQRD